MSASSPATTVTSALLSLAQAGRADTALTRSQPPSPFPLAPSLFSRLPRNGRLRPPRAHARPHPPTAALGNRDDPLFALCVAPLLTLVLTTVCRPSSWSSLLSNIFLYSPSSLITGALLPEHSDDLLGSVDQPLQVLQDANDKGREFLACDYNRDGDSFRRVARNTKHEIALPPSR